MRAPPLPHPRPLLTCRSTRLTELDLRGNQLASITGLEHLPSLVHVNLDQNALTTLALPAGARLPTVRSLKLTQNAFAAFDATPFPALRILYMDDNALTRVAGLGRARALDAASFRRSGLLSTKASIG